MELSRSVEDRHLANDDNYCRRCDFYMQLVPSLTAFSLKGGGWTAKTTIPAEPAPKKPMRGYDMTGSRND